jgi:hypothetical protein
VNGLLLRHTGLFGLASGVDARIASQALERLDIDNSGEAPEVSNVERE